MSLNSMRESSHPGEAWHARLPKSIKRPVVIGLVVLCVGVLGFGVWAGTAPINSAIIASGKFIATGQNKIIQHLEGGIVDEILVDEGDVVGPGQVLVRLDDMTAKTQVRRLHLRLVRQTTLQARLESERLGRRELHVPAGVTQHMSEPEVAEIVDGQRAEFEARRTKMAKEIAILKQRIAGIEKERVGLAAQTKSVVRQEELIARELEQKRGLYKKGLTPWSQVLALEREAAKLEGNRGDLIARDGRAVVRITETEEQIAQLGSKRVEEATKELREVEGEIDDLEERLKKARDDLSRLEVRAPVKGIVVKLSHHTPGGVISPGQEILELLPAEEDLLVEAFVRPDDIDVVQKGNTAQLRLIALKQRVTPMVAGRVTYVSADTIEGKQPGEMFYVARIRPDKDRSAEIKHVRQAPGMPVEVYIETGEQTFFEYLVGPISDSFSRAFREQ